MAAAQAAANHGDERQNKYKPWRCKTNTRVRRKKETQQNKTVRVTVRNSSRKVGHLVKVMSVSRPLSSTRID